jgi:hypothetical protein
MKNIGKYLLTHECITLLEFYTTKWWRSTFLIFNSDK